MGGSHRLSHHREVIPGTKLTTNVATPALLRRLERCACNRPPANYRCLYFRYAILLSKFFFFSFVLAVRPKGTFSQSLAWGGCACIRVGVFSMPCVSSSRPTLSTHSPRKEVRLRRGSDRRKGHIFCSVCRATTSPLSKSPRARHVGCGRCLPSRFRTRMHMP